ncbi:rRNA adenine N-6-methyltransferase family protein [Clostridiaceae bacterium 35-E11]
METKTFIKQYIGKPRIVGAILPSSQSLASKMIEDIKFENAQCIVEYGPGTGVFTKELIRNRNTNTILLIIEYNYDFYKILKSKYKDENNLYLVHDSAENVDKYLEKYGIPYADYVVSGLPFACLPEKLSTTILNKTKAVLKTDGKFITFQYTLFKKQLINRHFNRINIKREFKNIPPAYILSCNNQ